MQIKIGEDCWRVDRVRRRGPEDTHRGDVEASPP